MQTTIVGVLTKEGGMSLFTEQGGLFAVNPHKAVDVGSRVEVSSPHQVLTTIAIGHCKKHQ